MWYTWTGNSDAPVEFDTYASQVDTVMAVYTGSVLANLDFLVGNDDINNEGIQNLGATTSTYMGPSGVKFNARRGTKYYIVVGTYSGPGGPVTLSWAYVSSGIFRFSADTYDCAESDMWESIISTTAWSPLGARITVTRQFGTVGKCIVNFAITNGAAVMPPFTEPAIPGRHFFPPSRTSLIFDAFEIVGFGRYAARANQNCETAGAGA